MAGDCSRSGTSGRSLRGARSRGAAPLSQINVTPFVDVMLVLLIVFMVAAPMMTPGLSVDLPEAGSQYLSDKKDPLILVVAPDNVLFLDDVEIAPGELAGKLAALPESDRERNVYVHGDKSVYYGQIAQVMGVLGEAGFFHISLVTRRDE